MTLNICVQRAILFGIGGILLAVGIVMAAAWPYIFRNVVKSQLALSKGSKTYDMWVQTPIPMYIDIYLYNWTNVHDTLNHKVKPNLQQVGPYVFSEQHNKVDVKWNDNDTVTYKQYRKWIFHPEMSNGSLSDTVTNFNVIVMTIGRLIKNLNLNIVGKFFINEYLHLREKLVVTKNVSQLLFDGYGDPLLQLAEICKKHNISIPVGDFDKFGWFYKRNMSETADGVFTMYNGEYDITKVGDVATWNGQEVQKFYSGDCAKVKGSLGELWSPTSDKKHSIDLFAFDICGGLSLTSAGTLTLLDLSGSIFVGNENVFDNGTLYPEAACYSVKGKQLASGIRDVSPCRAGAPVFVSFPHFYLADPVYRAAVTGLDPVPEKHSFSVSLEENTGVPLRVSARLQINLYSEPIEHMSFFEKVPNVYMPMIWFDQHALMTDTIAEKIRPLSMLSTYGMWVLIGVASLGGILVSIGLYLALQRYWKNSAPSQSESLLVDDGN